MCRWDGPDGRPRWADHRPVRVVLRTEESTCYAVGLTGWLLWLDCGHRLEGWGRRGDEPPEKARCALCCACPGCLGRFALAFEMQRRLNGS